MRITQVSTGVNITQLIKDVNITQVSTGVNYAGECTCMWENYTGQ